MGELLEQVATKLGLTVEGVVEAYPMLKSQYIKMEIIDNIKTSLVLVATVVIIVGVLMFVRSKKDDGYAEWVNGEELIKKEHWGKYKKRVVMIFLGIIILTILLEIGKSVVAPDYMLIKNLV